MAKSSFANPDLSIMAIGEHKAAVRRFNADPRRSSIQTTDPNGDVSASPWKVKQLSEADKLPRWKTELVDGKPTHFTENYPDPNVSLFDAPNRPKNKSVFTLRIERGVCLGHGAVAEVGDLVTCFGSTAIELVNNGQAHVIEEIRPA